MKKNICIVVSSGITIKAFLRDQIRRLAERYNVDVVVHPRDGKGIEALNLGANVIALRIERNISPVRDFVSLLKLWSLFRRKRYDVVHSFTPKAGLLAMTASKAARIKHRLHTFTGQVWASRKGWSRIMLKTADRLLSLQATAVLVDGHSQRKFIIDQKVVSKDKCTTLAYGSVSGVDTKRFCPDKEIRRNVRCELDISNDAHVFLFLGRLKKDKGILDLGAAFKVLADRYENASLLVVGPDEEGMRNNLMSICHPHDDKVKYVDFTDSPERYMAAADVYCLLSYREGFGTSVIEAASCGVPAITSDVYGVVDAVEANKSGLVCRVGDVDSIADAMKAMVENDSERLTMGAYARKRTVEKYSQDLLSSAVVKYYEDLIGH